MAASFVFVVDSSPAIEPSSASRATWFYWLSSGNRSKICTRHSIGSGNAVVLPYAMRLPGPIRTEVFLWWSDMERGY
jgi:hypothetical protein